MGLISRVSSRTYRFLIRKTSPQFKNKMARAKEGQKKRSAIKEVVTREYTINLHKRIHGQGRKFRAAKAIKASRALPSRRWARRTSESTPSSTSRSGARVAPTCPSESAAVSRASATTTRSPSTSSSRSSPAGRHVQEQPDHERRGRRVRILNIQPIPYLFSVTNYHHVTTHS